ncbi:MAG: efflux RND transporter periplasmic adaptor subunit [Parachlamydiaceae bacterium]|nr:efflux RND transporter periplasmic adaptor subunit [Parachlamydiaceae bacterium]
MPKKLSSILPWGIVALAALGITYFWISDNISHNELHEVHEEEHEEVVLLTQEQIDAAGIMIDFAQPGVLQKQLLSPGKIVLNADRIAHIYPKVSGIVKESRKNLGEKVKSYESIAVLESLEAAEIKATYLAALQKEKFAANLLQLEQNLHDKGHSIIQEYETSLNTYAEAHLALEVSRQKLFAFGLTHSEITNLPNTDPSKLRFYELRAPFEGNILSRHITIGELLSTSSEVYTIGDLSKLWVEISLYPKSMQQLTKGQPVTIRDISGRSGKAELLYIGSAIDEGTQRIQAIALLDNTGGQWQPGTFITAEIATEAIPVAIAISQESVQKIDGQECAFIVKDGGFEIRPIKTGRFDEKYIEVITGIDEGEKYAATNSFLLKADHEKDEAEHMH